MPLAAGTGAHSQPRWSPDGDRLAYISTAEGGQPQLFVRWMASGEAVRITGLPNAPSEHRLVARRPADRLFDVRARRGRSGSARRRPGPKARQWAEPLQVITAVTYRADGQGYIRPGYDQIFLVSAEGGAPRQLSFGPYNNGGPLAWTPDGRTLLFSGNRSAELGARGLQHRNLRARHRLQPDHAR